MSRIALDSFVLSQLCAVLERGSIQECRGERGERSVTGHTRYEDC